MWRYVCCEVLKAIMIYDLFDFKDGTVKQVSDLFSEWCK